MTFVQKNCITRMDVVTTQESNNIPSKAVEEFTLTPQA